MKTFSLKGNNTMQNTMESKFTEERVDLAEQEAQMVNLANEVNEQQAAQQQNRKLPKKAKPDFNLYNIFKAVQSMVDTCEPTIAEMFQYDEEGQIVFTEAATILADTSATMKETLDAALEIWRQVDGEADRLRKGFIKDKVILNRYSRRGAEYAQKFDELSEKVFNLSALIVNIQAGLSEVVFANTQGDEVND